MLSWAEQELTHADLGDARLNKRLSNIGENLAAMPGASVPQASGDWAATIATYEFWKSTRIQAEDIREAHYMSVADRARKHNIILAIQDTTDFDFTAHPNTKDLGPIASQWYIQGLKVHSVLGATTQGVPLGLFHQQVWVRDPQEFGQAKDPKRKLKDKESGRWLLSLVATELGIPEQTTVVTVADREADIYDLFALKRQENSHLLLRSAQNRLVAHEARYLNEAIAQAAACGQLVVDIRRADDRPPRQATLTMRFATLDIQPPRNRQQRSQLPSVNLQVVLAEEENPPKEATPVRWLLLTTLPVQSFEDAVQCVQWYSYRWLIERYHYALKSGCGMEKLQLETADRLERALATYCIVAWRLLWLTYEARVNPDVPCDTVLQTYEWEALYCTIHQTPKPPSLPPTLAHAIRWIAQLGGFLARKHDGVPGVKVIWRGLRRLNDIAASWKLASQPSCLDVSSTCG